ncbi:MAG: phosphatase PAP2 family protein [Desulfovibrio sp.]|nr:phosphatase PAP2 family protein [Desulfovibrio sp.]
MTPPRGLSGKGLFVFLRGYPWLHLLLCLAPLALLLIWLALTIGTGRDLAAHFTDLRLRQPALTTAMLAVTYGAAPLSYGAYAWLFLRGLRAPDPALLRLVIAYALVQICISFLLVRCLKIAVGRPRPQALLLGAGYEPFTLEHGNHSFPSGHTSEIIGTCAPLAARRGRRLFSLGLGLLAALVGYSRIYLSMHHIGDIAAGMGVGALCALVIHYLSIRGIP